MNLTFWTAKGPSVWIIEKERRLVREVSKARPWKVLDAKVLK